MATIEHNVLSGSELHEPKGIDTATSDKVYVADGAGSGTWYKIYNHGWEDINDSGSSQSLTSGSWVDITNDGAGSNTSTAYVLPGYSTAWDTTNNQFDWSAAGLQLGDTVTIRFDVSVTTATTNDVVAMRLDMAHGDPAEYNLEFSRTQIKTAATHQLVENAELYMGNTETLNNPAKFAIFTDGTGNSVVVNGFYLRVHTRNPVFSAT